MDEQENIRLVQNIYDLFRKGDGSFMNGFADDISWDLPAIENVPYAGSFKGIEAVKDFFTRLGNAEESLVHNPTEFVAKDDRVIVLGNMKWRVKGTNKEYDSDFAHVLTVKDGKVNGFRELMDTAVRSNAYTGTQSAAVL